MVETQIGLSVGNILTVIGGFGIVFAGFYKLLCKKFDGIDKKFELVDKKFEKIDGDIKEVRSEMKELKDTLISFEKNTEHRLTVLEMEAKSTNQRLSTIEGCLLPTRKVYEFKESKEEDQPKEN